MTLLRILSYTATLLLVLLAAFCVFLTVLCAYYDRPNEASLVVPGAIITTALAVRAVLHDWGDL